MLEKQNVLSHYLVKEIKELMEERIANYDAEQEIDLMRLLLHVLHRWRSIVAITLVAAVLLAGVSVLKNIPAQSDKEALLEIQSQYEAEMSAYEYNKASYESDVESLRAYLNTYQEKSVLANLDPSDLWVGTANVFVLDNGGQAGSSSVSQEHDPYDAIVKAYQSELSRIGNYESLADEMGMESVYVKELITSQPDFNTNSVGIRIVASDEAMVSRIQAEINTLADSIHSKVKEQFTDHKIMVSDWDTLRTTEAHLTMIESWVSVTPNIADTQQKLAVIPGIEDTQLELENKIAEMQKALEELEKNKPEAPAALGGSSIVKDALKFGIIGGFVGCFLLAAWYAVLYILDRRIHSGEDLKSRYGVRILGEFCHPYPTKHPTRLDAWLSHFEEPISSQDVYSHIAAGVHILTRDHRKILLTGAADAAQIIQLKEKLTAQLPELELSADGNLNTNADVLRSLMDYDGIILVEASGATRYADVEAELSYIRAAKVQLLGVVVL